MEINTASIPALRTSLESLAGVLESVQFRLPFPGREAHEADRNEIARTIREYLLPRLRDPDAPVVAVIVGPTGVGKSTVMNSLAQDRISATGVLRPTTKSPVLWAHRDHAGRYWSEFVARVRERVGPALEVVIGDDQLTGNLTVIDTPPVDYASADDTLAAREVLALSDLCVFVTSPTRYADSRGWDFLTLAKQRGVPILFVLNRLPADPDLQFELRRDFAGRLASVDLLLEPDPSLIFPVAEGVLERWHGGLPPAAVGMLRKELSELSDPDFRHALVEQTTYSAVRSIAKRSRALSGALRAEDQAARALERAVDEAYEHAESDLTSDLIGGELRWLAEHEVWPQAAVDLTGVVTRRAGVAAQRAAGRWASEPTGARFLDEGGQGLWRHGHDTTYETQRRLEQWLQDAQTVAGNRSRRRSSARTRTKLVDRAWRHVFDESIPSDRLLRRHFGNDLGGLVGDLRSTLREQLGTSLRVDAERFIDFLGDASALRNVDQALEDRADLIEEIIERHREEVEEAAPNEPADDDGEDAGDTTEMSAGSPRAPEPVETTVPGFDWAESNEETSRLAGLLHRDGSESAAPETNLSEMSAVEGDVPEQGSSDA